MNLIDGKADSAETCSTLDAPPLPVSPAVLRQMYEANTPKMIKAFKTLLTS